MSDNTLPTAVQIGSLTSTYSVTDFIGSTDLIDYYKFTLDQNGILGSQVNNLSGSVKVSLIKDFDGDLGVDTGESVDSFIKNVDYSQDLQVEAGDYFIAVERFSGDTNYTLRLNFNAVPKTTASNPGNNIGEALNIGSLTGTQVLKDFVGYTDIVDYYKFTLDQNGSFGWQLKDLDDNTNVKLIKDFDNDTGIDTGDILESDITNADVVFNRALEAGDYIIEVRRGFESSSINVNYTLQTDFSPIPSSTGSNPGNDLNNALDLGVLSDNRSLTDFIGVTDGFDVYKFTLDKGIKLSWNVDNLVDNIKIELIQDLDGDRGIDNNEVLNSIFASTPETQENDLPAGEYFFRAAPGFSGDNTNYTFTLSSPDFQTPTTPVFPLVQSFNTGEVGQINTSTGAFTPIITDGTSFLDIAIAPNSEVFGVDSSGKLYRINLNAKTSTGIGSNTNFINALGFAEDGKLYGTGNTGFYSIDTNSGQATLIRDNTNFISSGDIVFDPASDRFFATSNTPTNSTLFSIALDGTATQIGNIGFDEVFGLFVENGTLFGYTAAKEQITINPATGAGTLSKTVTGISGAIGGAASVLSDLTVPTTLPVLDADGSGQASFARDGLLVSAFLFFNNPNRTDFGVVDRFVLDPAATRRSGNDVANFLKTNLASLDVDGSGQANFARDGLLISAFLFFNNPNRTDFSVLDRFILDSAATRRSGNDIANYLKGFLPSSNTAGLSADAGDIVGDVAGDEILGTAGDDTLIGNAANNFIVGGAGNDLLTGGAGKDTFSFSVGDGNDAITDFQAAEDLIQIDSSLGFADVNAVLAVVDYQGSIAKLTLSEGDTVSIESSLPLTVDNFVII
jgi:hypothetical protein